MTGEGKRANQRELKGQYDAWHKRRAPVRDVTLDSLEPWHRSVAALLPSDPGARVLEVGCGRGEFSRWLAHRFPSSNIVGVDFSAAAIDIAQAAEKSSSARFEVADATALPFEAGSFDTVISCECIEHIPRPENMAAEIYRVLRPAGRFFLTTENYLNGMLFMWLKAWISGKPIDTGSGVQPHENFFLFWRVRAMLEKKGLRVTDMESNEFQWMMLPRVSPSTLCTHDFDNPRLKRIFRPFGRHFTFAGTRP